MIINNLFLLSIENLFHIPSDQVPRKDLLSKNGEWNVENNDFKKVFQFIFNLHSPCFKLGYGENTCKH